MSILDRIPAGPDNEAIIRAALRSRLERDSVISPEAVEAALAFAVKTVNVRMLPGGWGVTENDAAKFVALARERVGWRRQNVIETPPESPMDKLKRANREAAQGAVKRNADGSYSPAE